MIGAKLHFKYNGGEQIYDGIKTITILHEKQQVIRDEDVSVVNRFIYIMNSFLTLRNFLPLLVDDPNVKINLLKDTVINQQNCFGLQIIDKGRMLGLGVEVHKADDPNF